MGRWSLVERDLRATELPRRVGTCRPERGRRCGGRTGRRSSYAAFMLQKPVLVALALALRPTDLPGDVTALVVATLGIVGPFAIAWRLVTRTPLRLAL